MIEPTLPEPSDKSNLDFSPSASVGQTYGSSSEQMPTILQGRWEILEPLGQGGMGTVYKARDQRLSNRLCVIKKMRVDWFAQEEREQALEFFDREARMLSNLKHPNIVRIYDRFRENENYYLVMEYVEGENLEFMLKDRGEPFSEEEVTQWAITICQVLHYLHSCRPPVIYRDLKPSNIMLDATDGIKLVDFGIARPYREDMDNTHVVSGGYSPPEQYWGGADTRSDIYALGATMYFLLTGAEPLALTTCSPKRLKPHLSDKIDRIIQKATSQYIELRYQYACEMREDLEAPADGSQSRSLSRLVVALCVIALIPIIVFIVSFFASAGKNIADSLSNEVLHRGDGEGESVGSLSKASGKNSRANLLKAKSIGRKTDSDIAPVASLLKSDDDEATQTEGYYPLNQASTDTREEMLTDPDGAAGNDSEQRSAPTWP